ncbi:MAG: Na+/H+ antiporter NhaA [Myxococcota bacterium]
MAKPSQGLPYFLTSKLTGALLLMGAAVAALVWANSPFAEGYRGLFSTTLGVFFGEYGLKKPLVLWINDGLMGVFFFYVGLEIKREVRIGELSTPRKVALPGFAALGGMVAPALLFWALTTGTPAVRGWGIPMATDIAFALGVLAMLGKRIPTSLKVFLTALAIVDDIGAVTVIALFYTEQVALLSLGIGAALLLVGTILNRLQVRHVGIYFALGLLVWLAFLKSGVHATIAALLMAFTIPSRSKIDGQAFADSVEKELGDLRATGLPELGEVNSLEQQENIDALAGTLGRASSPLIQLEHALVPVVGLLVMPVFALANAGVTLGEGLGEALGSPLAIGILVGLLVGKPLGVVLMSFIAVRTGLAELPEGVTWRHVVGAGFLSGIGFTMALFIAGLAFQEPADVDAAKVGILAASLLAGVTGALLLRTARPAEVESPAAAPELPVAEAQG